LQLKLAKKTHKDEMLSLFPLDPSKGFIYLHNKTAQLPQHGTPMINFYLTWLKIRMLIFGINKIKGEIIALKVMSNKGNIH